MASHEAEMRYPTGIIYKVSNSVNEIIFIGSTTQADREPLNDHVYRSKSGQSKFSAAIREIGGEMFSLEELKVMINVTRDELVRRAFHYIGLYKPEQLYNMQRGYGRVSVETRAKISDSTKGQKHPRFKRGSIAVCDNTRFRYFHHIDGKQFSKTFSYGPKSQWDREEAYFHLQQFRDSIHPPPPPTSADIAEQYQPEHGRFVDSVWTPLVQACN